MAMTSCLERHLELLQFLLALCLAFHHSLHGTRPHLAPLRAPQFVLCLQLLLLHSLPLARLDAIFPARSGGARSRSATPPSARGGWNFVA